jgi:2-amino-4-hydroxy-6-hydroxymethyldihydropteridine diphosphokinase
MTQTLPSHLAALAVLGLGANLGDPVKTLHAAVDTMRTQPQTSDWRISPFYRSAPVGADAAQPDYVNAVAVCRTTLTL